MKKPVELIAELRQTHRPTYEPASLKEFVEWAQEVVPASLAFKLETLYDSDTWDYEYSMPDWPLKMQLAIEHPTFLNWAIAFAGNTQDEEFAKGVTNGAKLLALASGSLACNDDGQILIPPRYD